jgi:hypothetical protein
MPLLSRLCLIVALSGLVSGCQLAPPGTGGADVTPNAVAGEAIEVTALDAAPAPAADPALGAGAMATAAAQEAPPAPGSQRAEIQPAPLPAADEVSADEAAPEASAEPAAEAEPAPPEAPKSEAQIACERKRGSWATTNAGLNTCVKPTRDGGKRCERESQCEGLCLARSGTCAPVVPLLGCNDILQDNGVRATLCIE